jgi:hypothetical protein
MADEAASMAAADFRHIPLIFLQVFRTRLQLKSEALRRSQLCLNND